MSKAHATVGKDTELKLANYLAANGWPQARRMIRTGFRLRTREAADEGDIVGTPFTWQSKSLRDKQPGHDPNGAMERAIPGWLAETESQRVAARTPAGFLVIRRWGTTDVGRWWVHQRLGQLVELETGFANDHTPKLVVAGPYVPIRMELSCLIGILHQLGWADENPEEATA
jgi:hypothetical protein